MNVPVRPGGFDLFRFLSQVAIIVIAIFIALAYFNGWNN